MRHSPSSVTPRPGNPTCPREKIVYYLNETKDADILEWQVKKKKYLVQISSSVNSGEKTRKVTRKSSELMHKEQSSRAQGSERDPYVEGKQVGNAPLGSELRASKTPLQGPVTSYREDLD